MDHTQLFYYSWNSIFDTSKIDNSIFTFNTSTPGLTEILPPSPRPALYLTVVVSGLCGLSTVISAKSRTDL